MKLAELIEYLDSHTNHNFLDGDTKQTLAKALDGSHSNTAAGEIIKAVAEGNDCSDSQSDVERAKVVSAIGPLRLKYQADDAPIEGFRMMQEVVAIIDSAFDEEAIRQKSA